MTGPPIDATAAVSARLTSLLTDATLAHHDDPGAPSDGGGAACTTITTIGAPHIHGSALLEDGRPSLNLSIKGAWVAVKKGTHASSEEGAALAQGTYAIPRCGHDPEFVGGVVVEPELTADDGDDTKSSGQGLSLESVKGLLAPALRELVAGGVRAGLEEATQ